MRKTILAFASVLIMLAAGVVLVGASNDSDAADSIPAPEKPGLEGYPITVFKQDGSKVGYTDLNSITFTDGDEIWIYEDINVSQRVTISNGIGITIHLHHSTVTLAYTKFFFVCGGSLEIEGTGTITETEGRYYFGPVLIKGGANQPNYSILTVGSNITLKGWAPVFIDQNKDSSKKSPELWNITFPNNDIQY